MTPASLTRTAGESTRIPEMETPHCTPIQHTIAATPLSEIKEFTRKSLIEPVDQELPSTYPPEFEKGGLTETSSCIQED